MMLYSLIISDVGRSCILVSFSGKNIMLDCGMHMGFNDDVRENNSDTTKNSLTWHIYALAEKVSRLLLHYGVRSLTNGAHRLSDHQPFPSRPLWRSAILHRDVWLRWTDFYDTSYQGYLSNFIGNHSYYDISKAMKLLSISDIFCWYVFIGRL